MGKGDAVGAGATVAILILFATLAAPQLLNSPSTTPQSQGGFNMTSYWWGACVGATEWDGGGYFVGTPQIEKLASVNATSVRIFLDKKPWDTGSTANLMGLPYKDYIKALTQSAQGYGLKVLLVLGHDSSSAHGYDDYLYVDEVITNVGGRRAPWIAWGCDVISTCKPDAIEILNEPRGSPYLTNFATYWTDFLQPSVVAYRVAAVAAGIASFKIVMQSYPFYSPELFTGIYALSDLDLILDFHVYYMPSSLSGDTGVFAAVCEEFYSGNTSGGIGALNWYLDGKLGNTVASRVNLGEIGVFNLTGHNWSTDPSAYTGWSDFMKALYNYTVNHGLHGLYQYQLSGNLYVMLTSGLTWTPYGQVFVYNMLGKTPTIGLSSYPRTISGAYSTNVIDNVITVMNNEGLNTYRMSIYYTESDATRNAMVLYYLTHCSYNLIVCRHVYNPGGAYSAGDWANAQTWTLSLLATFAAFQDRLFVEPVNECGDSDLATHIQTIVNAVRGAGYTSGIVANKWNQVWSTFASITDPLFKLYFGYHFYFNSWSVANAETQMTTALNAELKLINTEIGADFNEASQFDSGEVAEVNQFMDWCADRGIGNCVWMRYGLENYAKYESLNLTFPEIGIPNTPVYVCPYDGLVFATQALLDAHLASAHPTPPPVNQYYTVFVTATTGGNASPSGSNTILVGQPFTTHASANIDYLFASWELDGVQVSTNVNYTLNNGVANRNYTLTAMFIANPPPPSTYTLLISSTTGGSTAPSGTVTANVGTSTSITATEGVGYDFSHWTRNGASYSTTNPRNFSGSAGETITVQAIFVPEPVVVPPDNTPTTWSVSVTSTVGGFTDNAGINTLETSDSLTVTATPDTQHRFTYWNYDNVQLSVNRTVTVGPEVADSNHALVAVFQVLEELPPNQHPEPGNESVGLITSNAWLERMMIYQGNQTPIDFTNILEQLKKVKF